MSLQLLGAAAGLVALTTFVGGAMLWIRFEELDLPADQAVNLLPKQLLLVVGAHALAGAVCAGAIAALLFLISPAYGSGGRREFPYVATIFLLLLFGSVIAAVSVQDFHFFPDQLTMLAALVLAIVGVLTIAASPASRMHVAWALFAAFALGGAVLAVVETRGAPRMEPVAIVLDNEKSQGVGGFYIGQTTDRVYLAPLPGTGDPGDPFADADIDRVIEVKRDQVRQMAFREPTGIREDEAGREQAQTLLEDLRIVAAGGLPAGEELITTADPITAFAPLVHLHSEEKLWPMSAEDFLASSVLLWTHDGPCPDWSPGTEEHAEGLGKRADLRGRFDRRRLAGPNAYEHAAANRDCDEPGPRATAGHHTRPHDPSRTPKGLELDEGFALDLDDDKRAGAGKVEREGPQKVFKKVPVYYERHPDEPQGKRQTERITYWLFYGLSQPPGAKEGTRFVVHEGDWERISVLLAREDEEHFAPISVRYHAHDGNRDVAWPAVKRVGTGGSEPPTHPVVFSARGSHASYWRAGSYENLFSVAGKPRFAVHDEAIACTGCPQWRAWEFLLDARVQPWYGFGGAWGQPGGMGGTTGPLGPSSYKTRGKGRSPEDAVRLSPAPIATPTATPKATPTVTPAP